VGWEIRVCGGNFGGIMEEQGFGEEQGYDPGSQFRSWLHHLI